MSMNKKESSQVAPIVLQQRCTDHRRVIIMIAPLLFGVLGGLLVGCSQEHTRNTAGPLLTENDQQSAAVEYVDEPSLKGTVRRASIIAEVAFSASHDEVYVSADGLPVTPWNMSYSPVELKVVEVYSGEGITPGDVLIVPGWMNGTEGARLVSRDHYSSFESGIIFANALEELERWDGDEKYWIDYLEALAESRRSKSTVPVIPCWAEDWIGITSNGVVRLNGDANSKEAVLEEIEKYLEEQSRTPHRGRRR